MYCDKCHKDYQPIFDRIHDAFRSFIENNRQWISTMEYGDVINMPNRHRGDAMVISVGSSSYDLCCLDMLEEPFNVRYVGLVEGGEGDFIVFLDEHMDKLYRYYDVM